MTNKDTIKGAVKEMGGELKEGVGKLTGDKKMEFEGTADQAAGKVQSAYGKAKDSFKK